jgi:acyl carrier protein
MSHVSPPPTPPTEQPSAERVAAPGRAEIVDWLAGLGERSTNVERIDSMELAWLVHQVEQRYSIELADEYLDRIRTIDDAVAVIAEALAAAAQAPILTEVIPAGAEPDSHG